MNMMQTAQVPPALEALMSMGARPTAPGPGGQPVPTVAASIAQQQSPAGIEAVMPGVQQQAMNMAQAQQPVTMGQLPPQLQQAIQQARGPQGQGVAGLPAANMSFADGGVVGYAGPEGSYVDPELEALRKKLREQFASQASPLNILGPAAEQRQRAQDLMRMLPRLDKEQIRNILGQTTRAADSNAWQERGPGESNVMPQEAGRTAAPPMAASTEGRATAQNTNAPPQFNLDPNNPQALNAMRRMAMQTSGVERQSILNKIAELEAAQQPSATGQSRSVVPESTGISAALPASPTQDKASVEAAGKQYPQQTQDRIRRMQEIERQRSEMAKGMPDLNAEGIAALEATNRAREEMLAQQRGDDKFNRRMALYREIGGRDRDAYGRAVANQQARDQAANQADLLHKQSVIKLREAQQAKQLGQFDRALGFEKEAAELENKANDFELRAKQIATQMATNEFSGLVSLRGQDMQAQRELKSMAPAEQMMAERAINDWLGRNPGKSYSDGVEWYKTIGQRTPPTDRSVLTYAQAAKIVDERLSEPQTAYALMNEEVAAAKRENRQPRSRDQIRETLIRRELQMAGGGGPAAGPTTGGAVDRNNPLLK
jgi:hypothetical protein